MALILVHNDSKVNSVLDDDLQPISNFKLGKSIPKTLQLIALQNNNQLVVWCHQTLIKHLNIDDLKEVFHHNRILASFNPTDTDYFPKQLGYIERSFVLKINKTVTFPTWVMSSHVGGINTLVLVQFDKQLNFNQNTNYFLTSLAKLSTTEGLFCYSEPKLLKDNALPSLEINQASTYQLFTFVKQHYKWVWVFFLAACYLIYEKQLKVLPLIKSLFYKQLSTSLHLDAITVKTTKKVLVTKTVDVIIPTIGRKHYLYDVLKDLTAQTVLPKNVIIVEQNPVKDSESELDYLTTQDWPFTIKHTFTHQTGVVNARNLALKQVESEWTFFADDDIRFNHLFIEASFNQIEQYGISVLNYLCLQPEQTQTFFKIHQTSIFGSGSSMVKSETFKNLSFDTSYEFGFGEDNDFGMQLRNKGYDVIFVPDIKIIHLKAPIGGYRTKVKQLWADDAIQPKPSPTIMLLNQTYFTNSQLLGYKLFLGIRGYRYAKVKLPLTYIKKFRLSWKASVMWSKKI